MGYKDLNLLSVFLEPSPIHSLETDLVLAVKPQYPEDVTYLEHLTCNHQELELSSVEKIMELLISASPDLITVGYRLSSMPPS